MTTAQAIQGTIDITGDTAMTPHTYDLYILDALPEDEEGNRVYPERHYRNDDSDIDSSNDISY